MRPTLRLLQDGLIDRIIAEAREVLCKLGVEIHNESVLGLLADHGAEADKNTGIAEPPVAVVDKLVDARGTRKIAEAYLNYLYAPEGQEIAAKHFYRPRNAEVAAKYADKFPKLDLFTVDDVFGGWQKAQRTHFADGGIFDQIYEPTQH